MSPPLDPRHERTIARIVQRTLLLKDSLDHRKLRQLLVAAYRAGAAAERARPAR